MNIFHRIRITFLAAIGILVLTLSVAVPTDSRLDREQKEEFLLHSRVIRSQHIGKGITNPYRLTLTDGTVTHDAAFQSIYERRSYKDFGNGTVEINYVDSYLYNIAAYRLGIMLGLEKMMPVTVERKWDGMIGSLSWWLPVQMDEGKRIEENIRPPDVEAYNRQMHKMRVFAELVYDTDRNRGNVLIGENWEVYMIDFSRAFRLYRDLKNVNNLERCSRVLLANLQKLDQDALVAETEDLLTKDEVKAVIARRDLIIEHFRKLVAEKGEEGVLY